MLILCALAVLASTSRGREMGEPDLSSEAFVRRFTATYGVLSEREPPLTDLETAILRKLAPMMRVDKKLAADFLKSLTSAQETAPSATFNYLLGNIYFENDEYLLAETEYKTAIEAFPDFQRAWTNLGVLKLRSGDTRSALVAFLKAVELGDSQAHTFGLVGYCHFQEGNFMSAELAYSRAVLADPENLDWLEGMAQVYVRAERYTEAVRMQDELIARRPQDANYWLAQTNSYLAMERWQEAVRNLEIVHGLGAGNFQTYHLLGGLYTRLKMPSAAARAFLAAAEKARREDAEFLLAAAGALLQNKQVEAARSLHARVGPMEADLGPDLRWQSKVLGGDLAKAEEQWEVARRSYEEAVSLRPLDGQVLVKLALVHLGQGDRDKAHLLLDRAEHDPAAELNALLARLKMLIEEERFEASQAVLARVLKLQASESLQMLSEQVEQAVRDRQRE